MPAANRDPRSSGERASRRLLSSFGLPLLVGVALAVYSVIANRLSKGEVADGLGISIEAIVLLYLGAGVAAGGVIAVGGRWATTRGRGAVLGFVAGALVALPVSIILGPHFGTMTMRRVLVYMLLIGVFPGSYVGALYWRPPSPHD